MNTILLIAAIMMLAGCATPPTYHPDEIEREYFHKDYDPKGRTITP